MQDGLIDVHHHARPTAFFEALAAAGRTTMGGRPFPPGWTAASALSVMDEEQIATALLSAPDADLIYRDRDLARRLSRLMNELFAASRQAHPGRFGGFASLPLPHLDDALKEIEYALDSLALDGVMLSTSYDGHYLGNPRFEPLLSELNRRRVPAFVHPVSPVGATSMDLPFPAAMLEYAFDTTRCIANLLHHGVPRRYPGISFIFSHGGGAAPYLAERLSFMDYYMKPGHALQPKEDHAAIVAGLRSFFYDTALATTPTVLGLLQKTVGGDRILFGSDYPQVPRRFIAAEAAALLGGAGLSAAARPGVVRGNAVRLIPRLAG